MNTAAVALVSLLLGLFGVALGALLLVRKFNRRWYNGVTGELRVRRRLRRLDSHYYRVFNTVYLPGRQGRTTEIDHLVVSSFGVFVIETKNFAGDIYGRPDERNWTLRYSRGPTKQAKNPLAQNRSHVNAVQRYLGLELSQITSIVALVGPGRPMTYLGDEVVSGRELLNRIGGHTVVRLDPGTVDRCLELLRQRASVTTRRQHVEGAKTARALSEAKQANRRAVLERRPRGWRSGH
jgi:restriction system protein